MSTPDTTTFVEAVAESNPISVENVAPEMTTVNNVTTTTPTVYSTTTSGLVPVDAVEKAREQEKSKLYPQIESLKEELAALRREKDEREAEEARLRAEAEAEAKRLREEEMDVRELLRSKEQEWSERLEQERLERERAIALLDQERHYQELMAYRQQRLEAERDNIMPELIDLVDGGSAEEIEASINSLKDRTSRILESAQQAMTSARRDMAGTRITDPAAGPLDTNTERQFSPEDISNMSMSEYQKYRASLLGSNASGGNRGLFG